MKEVRKKAISRCIIVMGRMRCGGVLCTFASIMFSKIALYSYLYAVMVSLIFMCLYLALLPCVYAAYSNDASSGWDKLVGTYFVLKYSFDLNEHPYFSWRHWIPVLGSSLFLAVLERGSISSAAPPPFCHEFVYITWILRTCSYPFSTFTLHPLKYDPWLECSLHLMVPAMKNLYHRITLPPPPTPLWGIEQDTLGWCTAFFLSFVYGYYYQKSVLFSFLLGAMVLVLGTFTRLQWYRLLSQRRRDLYHHLYVGLGDTSRVEIDFDTTVLRGYKLCRLPLDSATNALPIVPCRGVRGERKQWTLHLSLLCSHLPVQVGDIILDYLWRSGEQPLDVCDTIPVWSNLISSGTLALLPTLSATRIVSPFDFPLFTHYNLLLDGEPLRIRLPVSTIDTPYSTKLKSGDPTFTTNEYTMIRLDMDHIPHVVHQNLLYTAAAFLPHTLIHGVRNSKWYIQFREPSELPHPMMPVDARFLLTIDISRHACPSFTWSFPSSPPTTSFS